MAEPGDATIFSKRKTVAFGPAIKTVTITIGTNVTLYDNTELKILCPVQAYPFRYRIEWNLKNVVDTTGISRHGLYNIDLIIPKTKTGNSGKYICSGHTLWGSDRASSFIVIKGRIF